MLENDEVVFGHLINTLAIGVSGHHKVSSALINGARQKVSIGGHGNYLDLLLAFVDDKLLIIVDVS